MRSPNRPAPVAPPPHSALLSLCAALGVIAGCWLRPLDPWTPRADAADERDVSDVSDVGDARDVSDDLADADVPDADVRDARDVSDVSDDLADVDVPDADVPDADVRDASNDLADADVPDADVRDASNDLADADVPDADVVLRDVANEDVASGDPPDADVPDACAPGATRCGAACCEGPCVDGRCDPPVGAVGNASATCAWTAGGAALCWGSGGFFGTAADDQLRPTRLPGITDPVEEVALANYYQGCARTRGGGLSCWINETPASVRTPRTPDDAPAGVRRVVAGDQHLCVLDAMNFVSCRGGNYLGQLGRGAGPTGHQYTYFARVQQEGGGDLAEVVDLAAGGAHTCARKRNGSVWCWGSNEFGQLGRSCDAGERCGDRGVDACSRLARPVAGLSLGTAAPEAQTLALGLSHSCVRRADGSVACWGRADNYGFSPTLSPSPWPAGTFSSCGGVPSAASPIAIPGLTGARRLVAGDAYVCASREHPTQPVVCWGVHYSGVAPVAGAPGPVAALAAGKDHACAISAAGVMACWGDGSAGQIAWRGTHRAVATRVLDLTGTPPAASVAAGDDFTCALLEGGAVRCWGSNSARQLGDGSHNDSGRPVAVGRITTATQLTAGYNHACARLRDGSLWCWGSNDAGQLGPIARDAYDPRAVAQDGDAGAPALGAVRAAQAGRSATCAVRDVGDGGVVECWGRNDTCLTARGYVDGGFVCEPEAFAPRAAIPLPFAAPAAVALTDSHACAREADGGAVSCWGRNYVNQSDPAARPSAWARPARVALPGPASDVSAGWVSSCAAVGGAAYCWGGDAPASSPPREVLAADAGVSAVRSGRGFDCARLADGAVRCWGDNGRGQLGDGTLARSDAPVVVLREGAGGPVPLDGVRELSAAGRHACATRADGVWCWGSDLCGQLGQGNTCRLSAATRIAW